MTSIDRQDVGAVQAPPCAADCAAEPPPLTVFYDGACPLCRREIEFYRRREGANAVRWQDVSATKTGDVAPGLSREQALARFHVRDRDGTLLKGGAAFARLWQALPGFRAFGSLFRSAPLAWMLDRAYDLFLHARPRLQRFMVARDSQHPERFPDWLIGDLRSDHAGETGAVAIYRGILAVSRDADLRRFAEAHLETERGHLVLLEDVLPRRRRSLLLPLWRIAGWLTGTVPALFGRQSVFATIDAVETFVDHHYAEQVQRLQRERIHPDLCDLLERCRLDEVAHRDEARDAAGVRVGPMLRLWRWSVGAGSAVAVALARRI